MVIVGVELWICVIAFCVIHSEQQLKEGEVDVKGLRSNELKGKEDGLKSSVRK